MCAVSSDFLYYGCPPERSAPRYCSAYRKCNRKGRAHAKCAVDFDRSAMRLDDLAGYRKAQPGALRRCERLIACLEEFLEDVRQLLGGDADPGVTHRDGYFVLGPFDAQLDRAAAVGELERVREKIAEHFVDAVFVPEDVCRKVARANDAEVDLALKRQHLERRLERMQEAVEVHLSPLELAATRLETADVEQALHQSRERLSLLAERRADFALLGIELSVDVFLEQLEISDDDVDRCLQLVRRNRHELRLQLVELGELCRHAVIAVRKPSEFVGALFHRGKALREVSVSDGLHSPIEVEYRAADRTRQPDRNQRREQKCNR